MASYQRVAVTDMIFPWVIDAAERQDIAQRYSSDLVPLAIESLDARRYSGFKVPCIFILALYLAFAALISVKTARHVLQTMTPKFYFRLNSSAALRVHFWEAPLFRGKHLVPISILGIKHFTLQAPLRYQALILTFLCLVNIVPLFHFYWFTSGERNVYWPDPHSQRSQLVRYLSDRTAVLAMGQLPLIILMSGRNSPVALLSGLDMNDLMLYHRYLARFAWMQVNIHSFGFVAEGIMAKEMAANYKKPCFNWGVAATAMFWALIVLSIRELRNRHYEIFVFCHIIFGMLALVGTYLHIHLLRESRYAIFTDLTIISAALWAFDRAIRFANQTYQSLRPSNGRTILQAVITTFPGNHLRLRIPIALNRIALCGDDRVGFWKIAAGHYVRLTAPDIQWVGDHPFTVMATGRIDSRVGYFDLAIKAQRGFTRKLGLSVADNHDSEHRSTTLVAGIKVKVEGPYGRSPEHIYLSDSLLLFGGGIGITYVLPLFVRFALRRPESTCKLVWMIRDIGCFEIIKEQIMFLVYERRKRGDAAQGSLSIDLHLTCGPVIKLCGQRHEPDNPSAGLDFDLEDAVPALHHGDINHDHPVVNHDTELKIASDTELKHADDIQIEFAKPTEPLPTTLPSLDGDSFSPFISITTYTGRASLLPSAHFPTSDLNATQYLSVVACGPAGMCDEARVGAIQTISEGRWKEVGFIEECYSW